MMHGIAGDASVSGCEAAAARFRHGSGAAAIVAILAAGFWPASCGGDPFGPDPETVTIVLEVSGGFAGVEWAIEVDGEAGVVRGRECISGCDFEAGQVLVPLSGFQISDLARELEDAGVFRYGSREFGTECCDQFEYRLTYDRAPRDAAISGSSGALPEDLAEVIGRLHALAYARVPAILDFTTTPDAWPGDPLILDSLSIDGSELVVHVSYSGGCAEHPIDLVIWNGFLESHPVQTAGVLAHDARDDACDAIVHATRRFDLTPLREAYAQAYGPGAGTVILEVRTPGSTSGRSVEYRF